MKKESSWFAVYTKPRWEKKVHQMLSARGFESYCPLSKVKKRWSDRVKIVSEPLFKSYVFVKVSAEHQTSVRYVAGVINFVYWQGKPAEIKETEIDLIRKFMSEYQEVEAIPLDLKPLDEVMINRGVLVGQTGQISRILQHSAEVVLQSLGYRLVARFEKASLVRIDKSWESPNGKII